jgi:type I restriction enzyme, S subunit
MNPTWPMAKLGEVLSQYTEYIDAPEPREYPKLSVKLYGRGVVLDTSVNGATLKMMRHQIAKAGQVVLSEIWGKKGAIGFVPEKGEGALCTSHFFLFDISNDKLDRRWLQAIFDANYLEAQLDADAKGTTGYAAVRPKTLLGCQIPLPPLSEQRRIVARIEELAAKINEVRGLRQKAAVEARNFVLNVHSRLAGDRRRKLGDFLTLDEQQVLVTLTEDYPQVGVRGFGGGLFPKASVHGTDTTYTTFNRLYEGALVLSQVKGWEGAVAVCDSSLAGWYVSPEYRTFRSISTEARPNYLSALVRTEWFWSRLKDATRGVGARRERTRPEQFLEIKIPMPNLQNQSFGEKIFAKVDALKKLQAQTDAEVDALLPSVLDKAFKGEL